MRHFWALFESFATQHPERMAVRRLDDFRADLNIDDVAIVLKLVRFQHRNPGTPYSIGLNFFSHFFAAVFAFRRFGS
jgi:hypothetical protein